MSTGLENRNPAEVCTLLAAGRSIDPELLRKIDEEAEAVREEIRRRHGIIDVAVELVREARTEA